MNSTTEIKTLGNVFDGLNELNEDILRADYPTYEAEVDKIENDEVFYTANNISENDRLRNYQLTKSYLNVKMNTLTEDDFIGIENITILKSFWKLSFKASLDTAKVFVIEEDVVPMLLHTECADGNMPFPSTFIDARVQIKNRTYFGFHIGSYYTEKVKYRAIIAVYSKHIIYKGERTRFLFTDWILLDKNGDDETLESSFRNDYFHKKIRHFCYSFCSFINEPDVIIQNYPLNPKNNQRRIERGVMPLPEHKNVVIHGKLRQYVNKQYESLGGNHRQFSYSFWVRGFYRHYHDKKKYAHLYAISHEDLQKAGFTWSEKYKDTLRKWIKPHKRGQGILIKQSWNVEE